MGTQLILTVGTNPLPVWVAWYHLKEKLQPPIKVRLVHTAGTVDEKKRLELYFEGASFLDPIQTSAGDPNTVYNDIRRILRDSLTETADLHVHYTGGTKVMGVETVSAIEAQLRDNQDGPLQTSYLDPRGESGPTIVSRDGTLVSDTRQNVDLEFNRIALLNGFTLGPFEHKYWDGKNWKTEFCPGTLPDSLSQEQLEAGVTVLSAVCDDSKWKDFRELFSNRDSEWNRIFSSKHGNFSYPQQGGTFNLPSNADSCWQEDILPKLNPVYPHCRWNTIAGELSYPSGRCASEDQRSDLEQMHKFFNGIWLEYGAYVAFKDALERIKENSDRRNYKLFHNVYARRDDSTRGSEVKVFELDVVAVLGYQIVVVSCTVGSRQEMIKQKGMEAILRARQLGGDEARAIVLCSTDQISAELIENELKDEMGSASEPLQVWGRNRWRELSEEFLEYLSNDLHWK